MVEQSKKYLNKNNIIKSLTIIGKIIGAMIITVTSSYGAYDFIFNRGIEYEKENQKENTLIIKVDKMIINDSIKTITLDNFIVRQEKFNVEASTQLEGIITSLGNLKSYMIEKAATKSDLKKIYDIFPLYLDAEQKKNIVSRSVF